MSKFCQSCGMPLNLHGQDVRGTEANGAPSATLCSYCYQNGAYVEPNITFEQMKAKGLAGIASGQGSAVAKFFMKLFYPMQLKGLARWKGSK
ncbi:MAG: zinc ribbon domain-containing protein [Formosimonas sp.]